MQFNKVLATMASIASLTSALPSPAADNAKLGNIVTYPMSAEYSALADAHYASLNLTALHTRQGFEQGPLFPPYCAPFPKCQLFVQRWSGSSTPPGQSGGQVTIWDHNCNWIGLAQDVNFNAWNSGYGKFPMDSELPYVADTYTNNNQNANVHIMYAGTGYGQSGQWNAWNGINTLVLFDC
jgi:hypothetical protein